MAFFKKATNTILAIPEIEVKVKEATNNEPWGPSGSQMADIARATMNYSDFSIIMNVIWKRLNDQGKYWRHVYKSLLLLDYLIKNGSEQVVREVKVHLVEIQTLTQFAHIDEKDKDVGVSVRERAKHIVDLMNDDNRVKQERDKAAKNQGKWTTAISSEGYVPPPSSSSSNYSSPPMGSSPPPASPSSAPPQQQRRKDSSSDDEIGAPQQPGQRPAYAQAEMYAVMSAGHSGAGGAPQYPQAAVPPGYSAAAAPAGGNPYVSPSRSAAPPTTAAAAGLFGPSGGTASPQYGQPAGGHYVSPPSQPSAGSQSSLFGNPQAGSNPYAAPSGGANPYAAAGQPQQRTGFQGNYGAPASNEDLFNPRVGQPAAAPAAGNPYGQPSSNPFGASVASAPSAGQPSTGVTAANLGLFGMPQQPGTNAPAPAASPFAPVAAPAAPASAPAPSAAAAAASPFAPVAASGNAGGMQVMYTPQGQPIYVMSGAPPANAPVYVLVNGQLVPASQAGAK